MTRKRPKKGVAPKRRRIRKIAPRSGSELGRRLTYADLPGFQIIRCLRYAFPKAMRRQENNAPRVAALHERVEGTRIDRPVWRCRAKPPRAPPTKPLMWRARSNTTGLPMEQRTRPSGGPGILLTTVGRHGLDQSNEFINGAAEQLF
jgi:hypothetical protein